MIMVTLVTTGSENQFRTSTAYQVHILTDFPHQTICPWSVEYSKKKIIEQNFAEEVWNKRFWSTWIYRQKRVKFAKQWFIKVWVHQTSPTHIWSIVPNKTVFFFFWGFPYKMVKNFLAPNICHLFHPSLPAHYPTLLQKIHLLPLSIRRAGDLKSDLQTSWM